MFVFPHVQWPIVHLPSCLSVHLSPGRVGRTFLSDSTSRRDEIEFDPDTLAFGENEETMTVGEKSG